MKRNTALNSQRTNDPIPLNIALIISASFHPVALVVRGLHLDGLGCYGALEHVGRDAYRLRHEGGARREPLVRVREVIVQPRYAACDLASGSGEEGRGAVELHHVY